MSQAGFDVHVAVPREPARGEGTCEQFPVHHFFLRQKSTNPYDEFRCLLTLFRLYQQLQPTLVHHIGLKPSLYGGLAAKMASIPAAVHLLNGLGHAFTSDNAWVRSLRIAAEHGLRIAFRNPNHRVILQNTDDLEYLVAKRVLVRARAITIVGSGVDTIRFRSTPEPIGSPVILMAARLLWDKGIGEFIAAARNLRARHTTARFLLLGERDAGHPSSVPMSIIKKWQAEHDVEWLGWQSDMPSLLAQSHIACLPSYYGEGAPRFLIEAASSGRPIVTTDSPGCRAVVRHGYNGFLIPTRDSISLASALAVLIRSPALRAVMGKRSREIATAEFSVERVIEENLRVYRTLLTSVAHERMVHHTGKDYRRGRVPGVTPSLRKCLPGFIDSALRNPPDMDH